MAPQVLVNASVVLNGSDISDHCFEVEFEVEADDVETTAFSSSGHKTRIGGLKEGSVKLGIRGDYAAASIDSILWPLLGTVVTIAMKSNNAATSATNPLYSGNVLITGLTPITGSVGDLVDLDLTWPTSGIITRAVA